MRLAGKVALITGGALGQGAAEARLFAKEGCRVVVADVLEEEGTAVADAITSTGGDAKFVKLDVAQESQWRDAIDTTVQRFGKLDVLVNNAGIWRTTTVEHTTVDEWDEVMTVNARGVFLGTKHAIPVMREAGGGSIVNISSTTGLIGGEQGGVYGASKGAIRALTKFTAVQHAKDGIRANSVHPGSVDTQMIAANIGTPEGRATSISRIPLGRIGTVDDVAYGVLFLASDESSFITGAELVIDGGMTAQ